MKDKSSLDLRSRKTRRAIKSSFGQLVCNTDISHVTVSGIAEIAEINRRTFYLHYECIEYLFIETCDEIISGYKEAIERNQVSSDSGFWAKVFLDYFAKQPQTTERIICEPSYNEYFEIVLLGCIKANHEIPGIFKEWNRDEEQFIEGLATRTLFDMYKQWVFIGKTIPFDRFCDIAASIISNGVGRTMLKPVYRD